MRDIENIPISELTHDELIYMAHLYKNQFKPVAVSDDKMIINIKHDTPSEYMAEGGYNVMVNKLTTPVQSDAVSDEEIIALSLKHTDNQLRQTSYAIGMMDMREKLTTPVQSDAVEFHKWVMNSYIRYKDEHTYVNPLQMPNSRKYNVNQLYKIFKDSKQSNNK